MRNGSVVDKSAGRYRVTPHSVPMMNVQTKPSRFNKRHALNHAIKKMPALSIA